MIRLFQRRLGRVGVAVPLLALASLLGLATPSGATLPPAVLYATPAGAGTETCLSSADACTLAKALVTAGPGTTIELVKVGNPSVPSTLYDGGFVADTAGTTPSAPVTIDGLGTAIISGTSSQVDLTVGAMYLVLTGVAVDDSANGPGLRNDAGGSVTVKDSTFASDSNTLNYGGAIDNSDTLRAGTVGRDALTVIDSTFSGDSSLEGGAIFNENGMVDVTGSTFTNDSADASGGGAIVNGQGTSLEAAPGTLTVTGSTFTHDVAPTLGGAIDNADGAPGTAVIADSTFDDNLSGNYGGAVQNGSFGGKGTMEVTNSTFYDNQTETNGGAIDSGDMGHGVLTVLHSTFDDDAATGDGTAIDSADDGGTGSTTVGGDLTNDTCSHTAGTWDDLGYGVSSGTSCFNAGPGNVNVPALYADLSNLETLDSPLQIVAPSVGSAAASTIPDRTPQLCPIAGDERGMPSPSSGPCDAGAAQLPGGAVVKLLASQLPKTAGPVTYTVHVAGSLGLLPTGSVEVVDSATGHCTVTSLASAGGAEATGSCTIPSESAGESPLSVTATYLGDATYGRSSSTIVETQDVAGKSGTATGTENKVTVIATGGKSGSSSVSVSKYPGNPEPSPLASASSYFDVAQGRSTGGGTAAFAAVKIADCNGVTSSTQLYWWGTKDKHHEWLPVVGKPGPTYVKGTPACLDVTLTSSSTPTVAELTGTAFAATSPRVTIAGSTILDARVHRLGRIVLTATGGNAPYRWKLLIGTLPKLLTLSSAGVITGTPQSAGTTTVVVQVTDTATSTTPQVSAVVTLHVVVLPLAPALKSISPATGTPNGGTTVTIDGTNLKGATAVLFGATAAALSSIKVNAAGTVLTVVSPKHAIGAVGVTVTTPGGTSAGLSYKYAA